MKEGAADRVLGDREKGGGIREPGGGIRELGGGIRELGGGIREKSVERENGDNQKKHCFK